MFNSCKCSTLSKVPKNESVKTTPSGPKREYECFLALYRAPQVDLCFLKEEISVGQFDFIVTVLDFLSMSSGSMVWKNAPMCLSKE